MKHFQVRLADDLHASAMTVAKSRGISLADIVREAMEVHLASIVLIRDGGRVLHERPSGEKVEVLVPGISRKFT